MYLGNQPALSYTSFAKQDFTTSATTSYALSQPVANENEIALFINFVRQEPTTAYTASGTSLTLTSATSASDDMYAIFLGKAVQTVNPPAGSVGTSQLANGAVTSAKLASGVGGKVLQVVSTSLGSGDISTTSTSFVDVTGFSASITPSSTANKILILVDIPSYITNLGANGIFTILKDSTNLGNSTWGFGWLRGGSDTFLIASANYLDSPSSVSSLTYKIQYKISAGTFTMTPNGSRGTLTLMEIEG